MAEAGVLVSFHVDPAARAGLRQALVQTLRTRLRRLQQDGVVADWRLLFSRQATAGSWDGLAIVEWTGGTRPLQALPDLKSDAESALRGIAPAGAVQAVPVQLLRSRRADMAAPRPVVLAIPYQALVPAADYLAYADGYVIPQFQGWMREGVLSSYRLYAGAPPGGLPSSHLILLDYRDDAALAARAAVVARVRAELREQPAWRAISEGKVQVREERPAIAADDISQGEPAP